MICLQFWRNIVKPINEIQQQRKNLVKIQKKHSPCTKNRPQRHPQFHYFLFQFGLSLKIDNVQTHEPDLRLTPLLKPHSYSFPIISKIWNWYNNIWCQLEHYITSRLEHYIISQNRIKYQVLRLWYNLVYFSW